MGLKYPPEWRFEDDGVVVPGGLRSEVMELVSKIASSSDDEGWVVETFKSRFGSKSTSSTVDWGYTDLSDRLDDTKNGALFTDALWLAVEDMREKGYAAPTLAQVNKLLAKHGLPYQVDPPHLRRTDAPPKRGTSAPASYAPDLLDPASLARALGRNPDADSHSHSTSSRAPAAAVTPPAPTTTAALALPSSSARPSVPATSGMPTCFVAQPFHGNYQNRYDEDLVPAIEAAGLVPYKIDKDPAVDHILPEIEEAIRNAAFVLVDITEDNPNVWYELGYAEAKGRPVLMISCATVRQGKPYPFDVRGRNVLDYETGRRSAHTKLQEDVTTWIKARLARAEAKAKTAPSAATALAPKNPVAALDPRTRATLLALLSCSIVPGEFVSTSPVADKMRGQGFNETDASIGLRVLVRMGIVDRSTGTDDFGNAYPVVKLSEAGEDFVADNHLHLDTRTVVAAPKGRGEGPPFTPDDEIPF